MESQTQTHEYAKTLADLAHVIPAEPKPHVRNFPSFVDAYLAYTQGQEASEKIHRWVAIATIAAALERKVWLNRGYYTLFPNLYTFIIGASGIVRKSTSTGIGVDLLRSLEKFSLMSERLTAASLIQQLERSGKEFHDNCGEKQRQSAVFAYASELSVFLGEVFGSISELLTTFYDCSPNDWRKPWVYENKGDGETRIHGPCLNILGASTPTWLVRCIPPSEMEGGFSSRVIFVVENDPPRKFIAWPEVNQTISEMKPKLVADLARIHSLSGAFRVTPEAHKWFTEWYRDHTLSLIKAKDPRFSGYFGRKGDTILKIAMSLSVAESDSLIIEQKHIESAARELTVLEVSMYEAFGASGENSSSPLLRKVWNTIKSQTKIEHSELLKLHWRDVDHKTLVSLVEMLRQMGAVRVFVEFKKVIYEPVPDKELRL